MTIREAIDRADVNNINQYSIEDKVRWLSILDNLIVIDIYSRHDRNKGEEEINFIPYTSEDVDKSLLVPFPYDELYVSYLDMKICEANHETERYNNAVVLYNSYFDDYSHMYHRTHLPKFTNNFIHLG